MLTASRQSSVVSEATGFSHDYVNHLSTLLTPLQILTFCDPGSGEAAEQVADLAAALRGLKPYQSYLREDILPVVGDGAGEGLREAFACHTGALCEEARADRLDCLVDALRASVELLERGSLSCREILGSVREAYELVVGDHTKINDIIEQCDIGNIDACLLAAAPCR